MSNTTIELKYSQVAANVPTSLANGEIAINTNDGKIFYKDHTGTIQEFGGSGTPAGINGEIQFNNSGVFGATSNLSINLATGNTSAQALHTRSWIQWPDGTKQYTANAGGAGGTIAAVDVKTYTATAAQTTFAVTYTSPYVLVTLNGVVLDPNEYTATSNTNVVLTTAASANDLVHLIGFAGESITVIADDLDQYARNQANAAFDKANTDVTNISTTATVYGNTTYTTQINLAANGRINSITNTAIAFPVSTVAGDTGAVANSSILAGLLTVDGSGSGLDADLLDGKNGSEYANTLHTQAAFDKANTDVTNITTTATVYGNTTHITQVNLAANGRVNSIVNTAIAFPVTSVSGDTGAVANSSILAGLLTVDGSSSGLDADLLDGLQGTSYANSNYTASAYAQANTASIRTINFLIDGGGSVITTGSKGNVSIDFSGTISNWKIFNDVSGNMTVDISRSNLTNFGTFTASGGSSPSTVGQLANSSFAINWTGFTTVSANDVLQFSVSGTPTNATKTTVSLRVVS